MALVREFFLLCVLFFSLMIDIIVGHCICVFI